MTRSSRKYPLIALSLIIFSLAVAYYAEFVQHFMPCPLCLLQRYTFFILLFLFALGFIFNPSSKLRATLVTFISIVSLSGLALAIRQIYLQSLPATDNTVCLPGMAFLFKTMHWFDAFLTVLRGSKECGTISWSLLGLSMAWWSAFLFIILLLISFQWLKYKSNR